MSNSRRSFLHSTAAAAAGLAGAAYSGQAQGPGQAPGQNAAPPKPAAEIQVPKIKFGNVEISRMVAGCNPFYGYGHFNRTMDNVMTEWCTPDRVCSVLHQCNRFGINAYNFITTPRCMQDFERFQAEGGQMHLIVQGGGDPTVVMKRFKPLAIYAQGESTDRSFLTGRIDDVREYCKKVRQTGAMVGVGSHNPEVISLVEEQGWDVDFYAGCVYNRTRTEDQWKQMLHGEMMEMATDIYMRSDPARMYKVLRQTRKPCFAFKILAAGRVEGRAVDQAFQTAFESIKPSDGIFVGLFPKFRDEVRENADRVHRILARG